MSTENASENFTACGDHEAEVLLQRVLDEMQSALETTDLCVVLGGSYGRGDGGVRSDRENGILYNDLDFFVFGRKGSAGAGSLLKDIARKYEEMLKVDVDFSSVMSVNDIKNNAGRLMMQELKRGYHLVCGEDLLAGYLPELPAAELPYSEACRLLLNRGIGLLLAADKIAKNSEDKDFILRNINKAVLGACDAVLIAGGVYKWNIDERVSVVRNLDFSENGKALYARAVEFKKSPRRGVAHDLKELWSAARELFVECMESVCGKDCTAIYQCSKNRGEVSLKNYIKYCVKSRSIPLFSLKKYTVPTVTALMVELLAEIKADMHTLDTESPLYRKWLIFN